jgi:FkbM family methyltransferase
MMSSVVNRIGNAMPRWARRLILDRLGGARLVGWIASGSFVDVALTDTVSIWANPVLHDGLVRDGRVAYEDNFTALLKDRVEPGSVVYDIGANIGVFTFLAAIEAGASGAVVAFEPERNNLVCLRRSLERANDLAPISLFEVAVSESDGSVTFDRRGGAFSGRIATGNDGAAGASVDVPCRSLDSLVESGEAPIPTLIKIDVEGGEGAVLAGARRTLRAHGPQIMLELHHFAKSGVNLSYKVLDELGYRLLNADGYREGLSIEDLPEVTPDGRAKVRHILALAPDA